MAYQSPIPIRAHRPVNPFAVFLDDVPEATSSEIDLARAQAERELAQKSRTPIDFASIFSKGAIGGLQTAPDLLLGPTSEPSQFMRGLSDTWGSLESPQYKAQQAAQADEFNALGPDASLIDKGLLAGKHALTDPLGTAAMAAGNLAPFALGGVAGISGKAGAMGLSGVMGGGAVRGGIYDSIQQAPDLALMSDPRYAEMRKTMPEFEAKNALGEIAASFEESGGKIALGVGTGIASGALGAEAKALSLGNSVGAARNQLIRAELEKEAAGGLVKNFLRGAAEEGLSEFPEEGAQQYLSNIGAGAGGAKIDPWANVAESAVQASIAGTLGGGFSRGLTNLNAKSNLAAMNQEENAKAKAEGRPEPYPVAKPIIPPKSPVNGEVGEPDTDLEGTEGEELSAEQIAAVKVIGPLDEEIAAAREAAANESTKTANISGMGPAIVGNLYDGLFASLASGSDTMAGVKDPVLAKSRAAFEAGLIKSPDDLKNYVTAGYPEVSASQGLGNVANVLTEEVPPAVAGPLPDNGSSTSAPLVDVAPVVDETLPPAETVDSVVGAEQNPPAVEAAPVVEAGAVGPNGTIEPIRRLREKIKKAVQPRAQPTVAEVAPPADAVNNPVVDTQLPTAPAAPANNVVSNTVAAPAAQSVNSNVAAPEAPVVANAIHEGTVAQPKEPVKAIGGPLRGGDTVMLGDLIGTVHSHPLNGMVNVTFEDGTVKRVKISQVKKIATPPVGETLEVVPEPSPKNHIEILKELRASIPETATNKADFDSAALEYQKNPTPDNLGAVLRQAKKAGLEPWSPGEAFATAIDALKAGKDAFEAVRNRGISEASAKAVVKKAEAYMARMAKTEDVDLESQLRATIEAAKKNKPQFQRDAELSPEEFAQQQMDEYHRSFEEDMATRRMRRQQQADSLIQPGSLAEKADRAFKTLKGLVNRAKIAVSDVATDVNSRIQKIAPEASEEIKENWNGVNDDSRAEPWDNGAREAKKIEGTKFKVADFEGDVDKSVVAGLTRFKALADSISSVAARVANAAGLKPGTFAGFSPNGNFAGVTWRGRVWLNPLKHLGFTDNAAKMASRLVKTLVHEMIHTNGFGPHDDAFRAEFDRVMAQIQPLIKGMEFEIGKTLDKETIKRLRGLNGTAEKGWSVAREKGRVASVARRQSNSSVSSVQPKTERNGSLPPPNSQTKSRSRTSEGTSGKTQGVDSASEAGRATEAASGKANSERSGVLKPEFAREAEEGEILTKAKLSPRLVTELGETFYKSSPEVTIVREAIQNAVDSIPKSKKNGAISVDFRNNKLTVSDNGIGMSPKTLSEAFINPGESDKPEGTRGGFGLAKVGMIYSADSFNAETVWEDKAGNKIKSTLAATRDEWLASFTEDGAPMSVKSEKVDSDEPTGTTIEYAYGSREMSGYSIGNELKKMLSHDIPNLEITGSVDGSTIKPEMSYDSKKHTYVPLEFEEMTSKEIPGGTVEVKLSKSVAGPWGGRVEVMNGGLPQPAISISGVNAKKDGPEVVRINIIPNVPTTDRNYPFTPNREEVRDTAAQEIVTLVKQKINERVQAQNDKYKNRGMLEAKTPRGISVNAPDFDAPKEVLNNVAKSQSTEAIGIASSKAFDTIYDVLKDMLHGNVPKFAGLAILGDPTDNGTTVYGVSLRGEELAPDPNAKSWESRKFGDDVRINPWTLLEKSRNIADNHSFPYEDVLAGQIYGTLLHEITHSDARGHDETFSGKLTEFAGISASLATKVVNELRKAITTSVIDGLQSDSEYIKGFPYGDSDKPGEPGPKNSIDEIFKTLGLSKHGESVQESRSQEVEKPQFAREAVDDEEDASPFFSALGRAADQMKQAMKGNDALKFLSGRPGVKAAEFKWTGLDEFLKDKAKVTPQEVQDYLAKNEVKVEEVTKGVQNMPKKLVQWKRGHNVVQIDSAVSVESPESLYAKDVEKGLAKWVDENEEEISKEEALKRATAIQKYYTKIDNGDANPQYAGYQTPGGANYREFLLTLPDRSGERAAELQAQKAEIEKEYPGDSLDSMPDWVSERYLKISRELTGIYKTDDSGRGAFRSGHFTEKNIVVHVRVNDRMVNGKKVLFVEEIQSDWAQKGRREGFADAKTKMPLKATYNSEGYWEITSDGKFITNVMEHDLPADASGTETAEDLAIREAERRVSTWENVNKVPSAPFIGKTEDWTALALKSIFHKAASEGYDSVAWTTGEMQNERYDLSKQINELKWYRDGDGYRITAKKDGAILVQKSGLSENQLADTIGKDIADKIVASTEQNGVMSGIDLKVGGKGMIDFYDKIVPNVAKDVAKKFGAKVGTTELSSKNRVKYVNPDGTEVYAGEGAEPGARRKDVKESVIVHSIDLSPEMKEGIVSDKFPLFARESEEADTEADKEIELPKITWRQKATYEYVNKHARIGEMLKAVQEITGKKADVDLEEAAIAVSPQTAAKIGELKDYHVTPLAKLMGESKISIPDAEAYIHAKAAGEDVSEQEDGPNGEFFKALDEAVLNIIKLGNAAASKASMKAGKVAVDPEGPANGIIQRAIDRTQKIIVKAAENTFRLQVKQFLEKNISPDWAINPKNQAGGHTVSFQVDGKKQRMWFKDKVLASQIESLSDGETSEFMNKVRQGTRVFANVNTRLSPVFPIKNFIRDLFFGLGKVYVDDGSTNMMAVLKGVPEAFRDMIRHAKDPIASKGTLAHEMFSKGGMPAWFGLPSEENIRTMLEAEIKEFDGSKQGKAYIPFKRAWNAMRILSEASEGATRLAYFKVLKDSGMPIQEAIKKTRGVTGDFQRHGSKKNMRYAYAFFNSSIQGADAMVKLTKELRDGNPRARNLAMFLVAMGMSQALVGMGAGDDDKDGQNDYEQLPEYLKNANLIMPIPGHPIAIPLPYGLNVPIVAGMGIMRSLFSTEPDKHAKAAMNLWQATTKSFNPMGDEASLLQLISPTLLDPLAQSSENTDSLGRKIVRDRYQGEENLPDSEIKSRKDSEFAKTASSLANKLTGGSRVKPGLADVSPATIDNTVSWAGGSMLRFMKDLGAARLVGGKWTGNVPIFNDFVKTPKSYFYTGRFWDQLDEIRSLKDSARQLDENARKEQLVELGLDPDRVESISRAELRKGVKLTADRSDKLSKEVQQIYGKRAKLLPMYEELRKQISALNQSGDPDAEDRVEALVKAANRKYMEATR